MRIGQNHGVEMAEFLPAFLGEFQFVIHLLLNMRQHVAHDDVADLLKLHACTQQFLHAQRLEIAELMGCKLGQIELDRGMALVYAVIEGFEFIDPHLIGLFIKLDDPPQHDFDRVADADHFAGCIGKRLRGSVEHGGIERAILLDLDRLLRSRGVLSALRLTSARLRAARGRKAECRQSSR